MSATSRSRQYLDLPLTRGDYITAMTTKDNCVLVGTKDGRAFVVTRVARYKRPWKVHEIHRAHAGIAV